jgi:Ricin-type beta-trefoil lectin domain/GDSL-like Lipase/Acylhydrolase family
MKAKILVFLSCFFLVLFSTNSKAQNFPINRNVLRWPFSADSIWNMPIGSKAIYVPANLVPPTNWGTDEDLVIMTPNAPLTDVFFTDISWQAEARVKGARCQKKGDLLTKLPIPSNFVFFPPEGTTPNAALAALLPDGKTIYQGQPFSRCYAGNYATMTYPKNSADIYSKGIYGAHGGSGLSSLGGTIRVGELKPGSVIRHALKLIIYGVPNIAFNNDGTRGYRWPASNADGYANSTSYGGKNRALEMGALLALRPDFNLSSLKTAPAKIVAQALIDYGAYVVDDSFWDMAGVAVEIGPDGNVLDEFQSSYGFSMITSNKSSDWHRDMTTMFSNLHVIDNNSESSVGGGGTPRQPLAPPFSNSNQPPATTIPIQTPSSNQIVKIMPLGDSLTEGGGSGVSYRGYLRSELLKSGFKFDFVGRRNREEIGDTKPSDGDHSGHGGYTIGPDDSQFCPTCEKANLFNNIDSILAAKPDVIMLLIGINDMFPSSSRPIKPVEAAQKLRNLVAEINKRLPNAKLLVSSLLKVKWNYNSWPEYDAVNLAARDIGNASSTDNNFFVNLNNISLAGIDFADDLHLSASGAGKVANGWFETLKSVLNKGNVSLPTPVPTNTPVVNPTKIPITPPASYTQLVVDHSRKCLDIAFASNDNFGKAIQYQCHIGDNQQWRFESKGDGFLIRSKKSNRCLDVTLAKKTIGEYLIQWDCHGGDNQIWFKDNLNDGTFSLKSKNSGLCVEVRSSSYSDYARLIQNTCNKSKPQQWRASEIKDTALKIEDSIKIVLNGQASSIPKSINVNKEGFYLLKIKIQSPQSPLKIGYVGLGGQAVKSLPNNFKSDPFNFQTASYLVFNKPGRYKFELGGSLIKETIDTIELIKILSPAELNNSDTRLLLRRRNRSLYLKVFN